MQKRKNVIMVLSIIVTIVVLGAIYLWKSGMLFNGIGAPEKTLTQFEARKLAEQNLNLFESWKNPQLAEGYTLYNLDGNPSAYLFLVTDFYGKGGYITMNASTRFDAVAETSTDPNTPVARMLTLSKKLIEETNYDYADVKSEMLYLGGLDYYVKFTFKEGAEVNERYYDLESMQETSSEVLKNKN